MRREVISAPLVNALTLRLFSGGNQASARPQLRATAEIAEFSFPHPKRLCGLCVLGGLPTLKENTISRPPPRRRREEALYPQRRAAAAAGRPARATSLPRTRRSGGTAGVAASR